MAPLASAIPCETNDDCPRNYSCEVAQTVCGYGAATSYGGSENLGAAAGTTTGSGGAATGTQLPDPAVGGSNGELPCTTYSECVSRPCDSDQDCSEGWTCEEYSVVSCGSARPGATGGSPSSAGAGGAGSSAGAGGLSGTTPAAGVGADWGTGGIPMEDPALVPESCVEVVKTECTPKWVFECETASDCGPGFDCVTEQEVCECYGGVGGSATGVGGSIGTAGMGQAGAGATGATMARGGSTEILPPSSLVCPIGLVVCGDACVDVTNDPANCGSCGMACVPGTTCSEGQCGGACPVGLVVCGADCVDLTNDTENCGVCGEACPSGTACSEGVCAGDVEDTGALLPPEDIAPPEEYCECYMVEAHYCEAKELECEAPSDCPETWSCEEIGVGGGSCTITGDVVVCEDGESVQRCLPPSYGGAYGGGVTGTAGMAGGPVIITPGAGGMANLPGADSGTATGGVPSGPNTDAGASNGDGAPPGTSGRATAPTDPDTTAPGTPDQTANQPADPSSPSGDDDTTESPSGDDDDTAESPSGDDDAAEGDEADAAPPADESLGGGCQAAAGGAATGSPLLLLGLVGLLRARRRRNA